MDEQLKQIGERLRGLRDVLDIPVSEMAETIGIDAAKYEKIEAGELDITISNLMKIAHKYGVSTEELIFAESPHMKSSSPFGRCHSSGPPRSGSASGPAWQAPNGTLRWCTGCRDRCAGPLPARGTACPWP